MKLVVVTLLALVDVAVAAPTGPVSIHDNNIGDIVTVDFNANAVLSSNIEQNLAAVLAAISNQQAAVVSPGGYSSGAEAAEGQMSSSDDIPKLPSLSDIHLSPEMIEKVKSFLTKNWELASRQSCESFEALNKLVNIIYYWTFSFNSPRVRSVNKRNFNCSSNKFDFHWNRVHKYLVGVNRDKEFPMNSQSWFYRRSRRAKRSKEKHKNFMLRNQSLPLTRSLFHNLTTQTLDNEEAGAGKWSSRLFIFSD